MLGVEVLQSTLHSKNLVSHTINKYEKIVLNKEANQRGRREKQQLTQKRLCDT